MEKKKAIKAMSYLDRNLKKELFVVRFYEDNLHMFCGKEESKDFMRLAKESLAHAEMLMKAKHAIAESVCKKEKHPIKKLRVLGAAMREERGMEELYKYESSKVPELKTLLKAIAKMEKEHQKIVKQLASKEAKKLPKEKASKVMKAFGLK